MKNLKQESVERLIHCFSALPGVGYKTAQRYAHKVAEMDKEEAENFAAAILDVKHKVRYCEVCGNFTEESPCKHCREAGSDIVVVVAYPKDVFALSRIKDFSGKVHVLHGTLSPLENRGPNDIRIKELLSRLTKENIKEVVVATNPDVEGEATAMYLAKIIRPLGVEVSRLAQGVSMGMDIEYADDVTLSHSYLNRKPL